MSEELDCTFCQNLDIIDEEIPSSDNPIFVKKYYLCKASVFPVSFSKKELIDYYDKCTVRIEITGHGDVDDLLNEIETTNIVFQKLSNNNKNLMTVDTHTGAGLASPCISTKNYFEKVTFLASILEMDISELRNQTEKYEEEWKGLKLLKQYLKENDQEIGASFEFLEKIIKLRNKIYPTHKFDSKEVPKIMKSLGLSYPVSNKKDWQRNWDATLRRFTGSLCEIRISLQKTINVT